MKRFVRFCAVILIGAALSASGVLASDVPSSSLQARTSRPLTQAETQQRMYYGYVPPPPILHTWPGGYRVIIHELLNTLSEHLLGQY
jgi:hypothetical protein